MFRRLVGNENIKQTLRRLIRTRVANSMLFVGDDGIGKREFAKELCRALLCTDPNDGEACEVCPACRRALTFTLPKADDKDAHKRLIFSDHPDVGMVVAHNRTILVDAIRHLESEANYRPYEGNARFFLIDNADRMNDAAANALLKTLEEPPTTSYIFLITSRPDSLLPTVRSRCQTLRFSPVSVDEIERYLITERAFTHDEARLSARLSRGSIARAVAMNVERVRRLRDRMLLAVTHSIETHDRGALLRISEEMSDAKNKDSFEESIDVLESLIHDLWTLRVSGDLGRVVNADLNEHLSGLARRANEHDLSAWIAHIVLLRENLVVNINRRVATDALFMSMAG